MDPRDSTTLEGRTIANKYLIEEALGQGAMGTVYRAKWIELDKTVALKIMHPQIAGDAAFVARFRREARAASKLEHVNSVRVLDFGQEPSGRLFLAMEYLAGRDLLAVTKDEWPLPGERVIDILMQVLGALSVAHDLGIVHRDLKPENIMILDGVDDEGQPADLVKVCDFGIAKLTNDARTGPSLARGPLTSSGAVVGTPEYMSPEQARGETLDARSDIYSVGVILFQMLTGRVPFTAENPIGIILKHVTDDPPRPISIVPFVDLRLEAICLRALRKRREERYANAREMRADLRAVREQARAGRPNFISGEHPNPVQRMASARPPRPPPTPPPAPILIDAARVPTGSGLSLSATHRPRQAWVAGVALVAAFIAALLVFAKFVEGGHDPGASPLVSATPSEPSGATVSVAPTSATASPIEAPGAGAAGAAHAAAPAPPSTGAPESPPEPAPTTTRVALGTRTFTASRLPIALKAKAGPAATPASTDAPELPAPTVETAPATTTAPAPPPPPPLDVSRAAVSVGSASSNTINTGSLRAAIPVASFTACYQRALRARGALASGSGSLSVLVDGSGKIFYATLTSADWLPEMRACIESSPIDVQLRQGSFDEGGGSADVSLTFRAQ